MNFIFRLRNNYFLLSEEFLSRYTAIYLFWATGWFGVTQKNPAHSWILINDEDDVITLDNLDIVGYRYGGSEFGNGGFMLM